MVLTNTDALFTPIPLRAPRLPILGICNLAPYMHVPVGPVAAVGVTRLARIKARRGAHPYHVLSTSHRHCSTPPGHREVRFQTEYQTSSRRTTPTPRSNDLQETSSNLTSESSDDDEGDDAPGAAAAIPIPRDREGRVIALGRDGHSIEKWSQLGRSKYRAVKKVVDQVVKNHLHHSTPFHKQPENRKRVALDHVITLRPDLGPKYYAKSWLVSALMKARLSYTSQRWKNGKYIANGEGVVPLPNNNQTSSGSPPPTSDLTSEEDTEDEDNDSSTS